MAYTSIDDPSAYFQTALYTGNAGTQTITNDGNSDLQPDFLWFKERSEAGNHQLINTVSGINKKLMSNSSNGESTQTNYVTAIGSDSFSIGNNNGINQNSVTNVCWQWKAGGSASNNTDGNTTTSVSVNQTAGFSIMKYAGDGNNSTIGHGLGAKPELIIFKEIDGTESWRVHSIYTPSNASNTLALNLADAAFSQSGWISAISTSTISIGTDSSFNTSGNNYIAYAFAPKQGYSKIGSYTGNGNANGTFVYTGFKPAFIIVKNTSSSTNWEMFDNKRVGYNESNWHLKPNSSDAEDVGTVRLDILSNGFKIRTTGSNLNTSGNTYIYIAFAESPFVNSKGIPTTAR